MHLETVKPSGVLTHLGMLGECLEKVINAEE